EAPSLTVGGSVMSIASVPDLVEILRAGQLLGPAQLDEAAGHLQAQFTDPAALARELVRRGWLTPHQVNRLFQGHGQELLLGPSLILEPLGEGSMGRVFKARDPRMNRVVALKVIHKERLASRHDVERLYREAGSVAQLDHPNIVRAFGAGQVGDTHVFALEYIDGTDLKTLVQKRGALPVAEACEYARQAALGLEHAHERGVVHHNVKPAN